MAYPPKLQDFLDNLSLFESRQDRIEALIGIADRFQEVPKGAYGEEHRVPGCESEAFIWTEPQLDGALKYRFAVENPQGISAKALAVILDETLSGAPLDEVAAVSDEIVFDIFGRELSMGKSLGLTGMVRMVTGAAKKELGR
jgi:cysteine desulfuration protein SufE